MRLGSWCGLTLVVGCAQLLGADQFDARGGSGQLGGGGATVASAGGSGGGVPSSCGNGLKDAGEACDGADLGGAGCDTAVAPGWQGTVACRADCQLSTDGCGTPATTFNALGKGQFSSFDVGSLNGAARGFDAAAFDGRYAYFAPFLQGTVARLDAKQGFMSAAGWTFFDTTKLKTPTKGFNGAAFDGRYVYLVPSSDGTIIHGKIARYDTQGKFGDDASWNVFDIAGVFAGAKGFAGAVFDGRYLYLVPYRRSSSEYDALVVRYDTTLPFDAPGSWLAFDFALMSPGAGGYFGGAFDGRYVYFVPWHDGVGTLLVRYDTHAGFKSDGAWSAVDLGKMSPGARGYAGATFDGKFVYLVPLATTTPALRFDAGGTLTDPGAWTSYLTSGICPACSGYAGATFDGRYVYYAPYYNVSYHGNLIRYDTQKPFAAGSWDTFNVALLAPSSSGFVGATFTGTHVLLVPRETPGPNGTVVRFEAKSPFWLPAGWNASFL